ncbi:MAG TPA: YtxH domain-containing protein [Panacibacter sp.]|nr:YtxH domain-containing protein [Panacibacter sp.]
MSSQKFVAGLILGAAAGAAVALFLQTDKGKEILSNIKDAASDAGNNLKTTVQDFDEELNALIKKGKQFVEDLESRVKDTSSTV